MIARGDRHHDIAAWFGVNQGRIAEVNEGVLHSNAPTAATNSLPPRGPYSSGRAAYKAVSALEQAKKALQEAIKDIDDVLKDVR
jgi:hypothetical protein